MKVLRVVGIAALAIVGLVTVVVLMAPPGDEDILFFRIEGEAS